MEGRIKTGRQSVSSSPIECVGFHSLECSCIFLSFSTHPTLPFSLPLNPPKKSYSYVSKHTSPAQRKEGEQLEEDGLTFSIKATEYHGFELGGSEPYSNPVPVCLLSQLRPRLVLIEHKISYLIPSSGIGFLFASKWILNFLPNEAKLW